MWNLIWDLKPLKKNQSNFFLSRIWLFDALKRTQKINPKGLLNKGIKKPRLQFNLGLVLISLWSTGPWLLIVPYSCCTFPCKFVMRTWCLIKMITSTWKVWVFSLPVCWIVFEYNREKFHVYHFWEFKG